MTHSILQIFLIESLEILRKVHWLTLSAPKFGHRHYLLSKFPSKQKLDETLANKEFKMKKENDPLH